MLAINGFLEWFFLGLLSFLVVAVTLFGLFMAIQLFRNPGRSPRPRPLSVDLRARPPPSGGRRPCRRRSRRGAAGTPVPRTDSRSAPSARAMGTLHPAPSPAASQQSDGRGRRATLGPGSPGRRVQVAPDHEACPSIPRGCSRSSATWCARSGPAKPRCTDIAVNRSSTSASSTPRGCRSEPSREPDGDGCGRSSARPPRTRTAFWTRRRGNARGSRAHDHAEGLAERPEAPARPGLLQHQDVDRARHGRREPRPRRPARRP